MTRQVLSFYKLTLLSDKHLPKLRRDLELFFQQHNVLGRVYIGTDGLNAQISIHKEGIDQFEHNFRTHFSQFESVFLNRSSSTQDDAAFDKLKVKIRPQIVSDGIDLKDLDVSLHPNALSPIQFHESLREHQRQKNSILLDVRNDYECEMGAFPNTTPVRAETFREYMKKLKDLLAIARHPEHTKVLMVCTGGIRCSKAGLVMRNWGFKNVNMLQGGITNYVRVLQEQQVEPLFSGTNFTFDKRCGERVNDKQSAFSRCCNCGSLCDTVSNCSNSACNRLHVQCRQCQTNFAKACGPGCQQIVANPNLRLLYQQIGSAFTRHQRELL